MSVIDLYRSGYEQGYNDAVAGMRRLPRWELLLRSPTSLLPGVNTETYVKGYADGYTLGLTKEHWQAPGSNGKKVEPDNTGPLLLVALAKLLRGMR